MLKIFDQLVEAVVNHNDLISQPKKDSAYFIFGRMHPPTAGHQHLINLGKELAEKNDGDFYVFLSPSSKDKKSPLEYQSRLDVFRNNPNFKDINIVDNDKVKTPQHAAGYLKNILGYPVLHIIAGSDRADYYRDTFSRPMRDGSKVNVEVLGGERSLTGKQDPNDPSTIKGSKMRAAAIKGDFEEFKKGVPVGTPDETIKSVYDKIREKLV